MSIDRIAVELADLWPLILILCAAVGYVAYHIGRRQ